MKVVYIGVFKHDKKDEAFELTSVRDVSSYNYFTRGPIEQFMVFAAQTTCQKIQPGAQMEITEAEKGFKIHAYDRPAEGVTGIVITDIEYPKLVASSLLHKVMGDFTSRFPKTAYASFKQGSPQLDMPELKNYIQKYQNPESADSILKIQKELDETKIVMKQTIESVLERGEKIDDLVAKSDGLSAQSKMFYTQAKKQNSCCVVM